MIQQRSNVNVVNWFKTYLVGIKGNCAICSKVPDDVKKRVLDLLDKSKASKQEKESKQSTEFV